MDPIPILPGLSESQRSSFQGQHIQFRFRNVVDDPKNESSSAQLRNNSRAFGKCSGFRSMCHEAAAPKRECRCKMPVQNCTGSVLIDAPPPLTTLQLQYDAPI